ISGSLGGGGTASVGAAAGVPIVTKITQSYIGPNATVNALGQGAPVTADTGHFTISYGPYTFMPGVTSPDAVENAQGSGYNTTSLTGPTNPTFINNPRFTGQRMAARDSQPMRGVAVSADNQDDIQLFGIDGGVATNGVAVNVSGAVA